MAAGAIGPAIARRAWPHACRAALSQGGLSRARVLWPEDLLPVPSFGRLERLPPAVHPAFHPHAADAGAHELAVLDLPETCVLYHGPGGLAALKHLLDAWSWAAGAIGDYYPLLAVGLEAPARSRLLELAESFGLADSVRALPALPPAALANLYCRAAAVFHPAPPSPWSGPLRLGLACARPVVARETLLADALTGPAAYLVAGASDSRTLGAALITVVVEESVAGRLEAAARQRVANWDPAGFERALWGTISP